MQEVTLSEIRSKLTETKNIGFVKSMRKGATGIGFTLEHYLGIEEIPF